VPSFATALGSSGDRPAALAELMGIIANDGIRQPTLRVDRLNFAVGTPYETRFARAGEGERVLPAEVAALRTALSEVVEGGTARRLPGPSLADGTPLALGGKTGTGDNRIVIGRAAPAAWPSTAPPPSCSTSGRATSARSPPTSWAPRPASTTSPRPCRVQILKSMGPVILPHLEPKAAEACTR
jgi:hypothetical protein